MRSQAAPGALAGRLCLLPMPLKRAIHPVRGMPFSWAFNPYRGCAHACVYCYARRTHEYLGYNSAEDFERIILVKYDAPERLRVELADPAWRREVVAVGTATDPYQPVEGRLRLTRRSLTVFLKYNSPVSLVTKSTLILRDRDLLAELCEQAPQTTVWVTITTLDRTLARALEPGTPPPRQRLRAVRELAAAGVRVGVLVAPVLPGLTDQEPHLRRLVQAAAEAGACELHANPLRLCEGAWEAYRRWLFRHFPELRPLYARLFTPFSAYPARSYRELIERRVGAFKEEAGFSESRDEARVAAAPASVTEQLTFAW